MVIWIVYHGGRIFLPPCFFLQNTSHRRIEKAEARFQNTTSYSRPSTPAAFPGSTVLFVCVCINTNGPYFFQISNFDDISKLWILRCIGAISLYIVIQNVITIHYSRHALMRSARVCLFYGIMNKMASQLDSYNFPDYYKRCNNIITFLVGMLYNNAPEWMMKVDIKCLPILSKFEQVPGKLSCVRRVLILCSFRHAWLTVRASSERKSPLFRMT